MMDLQIEEYDRKPFSVMAVQVTPQNAEAVADWCGGEVVMVSTRLVGTSVDLPAVRTPSNKGSKPETAEIGWWVVERKGTYRAYKPQSFGATFTKKPKVEEENNDRIEALLPIEGEGAGPDEVLEQLTEDQITSQI